MASWICMAAAIVVGAVSWSGFITYIMEHPQFKKEGGTLLWLEQQRWDMLALCAVLCACCYEADRAHSAKTVEEARQGDFEEALTQLFWGQFWSVSETRASVAKEALAQGKYEEVIRAYEDCKAPGAWPYGHMLEENGQTEEAEEFYWTAIRRNESIQSFQELITLPVDVSERLYLLRMFAKVALAHEWQDCPEDWQEIGGLLALHQQKSASDVAYDYAAKASQRRREVEMAKAVAEGKLKE